jgi:hypothetical protein
MGAYLAWYNQKLLINVVTACSKFIAKKSGNIIKKIYENKDVTQSIKNVALIN